MTPKKVWKIVSDRLAKLKVKEFELYCVDLYSTEIGIKDQQLEDMNTSHVLGASLRVLKDDQIGFSYLLQLDDEHSICSMVDQAVELTEFHPKDKAYSFLALDDNLSWPNINLVDREAERLSFETRFDKTREMEAAAKSFDKRISKIHEASYHENHGRICLFTSKGVELEQEGTLFGISITLMASNKNESEMGWEFLYTREFQHLDFEAVGKRAARKAIKALGGRPIKTQITPAILSPYVATEFLGILIPSFKGENIYKNKSLLKDKKGEPIFSKKVTILDDGVLENGIRSAIFDAEGYPQECNILIEKGTVKNFLYDIYWAKKCNDSSTGNAYRAGIKQPPSIEATNLYLKPGLISQEQLLKDMNSGFFITEVMGTHTADPISGDFSFGASGFWVENGEEKFPVKGVTIAGNILNIFSKIEKIGNDLTFYGSKGAPSVLISELHIGGI